MLNGTDQMLQDSEGLQGQAWVVWVGVQCPRDGEGAASEQTISAPKQQGGEQKLPHSSGGAQSHGGNWLLQLHLIYFLLLWHSRGLHLNMWSWIFHPGCESWKMHSCFSAWAWRIICIDMFVAVCTLKYDMSYSLYQFMGNINSLFVMAFVDSDK